MIAVDKQGQIVIHRYLLLNRLRWRPGSVVIRVKISGIRNAHHYVPPNFQTEQRERRICRTAINGYEGLGPLDLGQVLDKVTTTGDGFCGSRLATRSVLDVAMAFTNDSNADGDSVISFLV
jgi:hypothetical protein